LLPALNADIGNAIETGFLRGMKIDSAKKRRVENAQPLMFLRGATLPILNTGLLKFKTNLWIRGAIFLKDLGLKQEAQQLIMQAATEGIAKR
jgi:hypothetical protein